MPYRAAGAVDENGDAPVRVLRLDPAAAARGVAGLAEVAIAVSAARTVEEITAVVVERGLAALGADGGAVAVRDEGDRLQLAITDSLGEHSSAQMLLDGPLSGRASASAMDRVLLPDREASLGFAPEMAAVLAGTGHQAWASLPLRSGDHVLGSLAVGWVAPQGFGPDEVQILEAFAAHCALGIDRLTARRAERARALSSHRMAEVLQLSMLTDPVQPDHLQVAVRYRPSAHDARVGGDWYDAFMAIGGELTLVIGDAAGHDREAAAVMGQLRNLTRGLAYALGEPPAPILLSLDRAMQHFLAGSLATAIIAQVQQTTLDKLRNRRRLTWSNAGHPPPLMLRPDGGAELLHSDPELLLGLGGVSRRNDHHTVLEPGSTLLLYTDGLVERRGSDIDDDLERLRTTAQDVPADDLETFCDVLIDRMGFDGDDDAALLAVRAFDPSRPRPPEAGPERLR